MNVDLPFVDEFDTVVAASPEDVYRAASRRMTRSFEGPGARLFSRALGCVHRGASYEVPPRVGQEANGFRVARADAPEALVLEGRHRFATYRLSFLIDAAGQGATRLRARTDASFPGFQGACYRAAVIGSGGHRVIVQRMLRAMKQSAERPSAVTV
jgi:hypothetical protein